MKKSDLWSIDVKNIKQVAIELLRTLKEETFLDAVIARWIASQMKSWTKKGFGISARVFGVSDCAYTDVRLNISLEGDYFGKHDLCWRNSRCWKDNRL